MKRSPCALCHTSCGSKSARGAKKCVGAGPGGIGQRGFSAHQGGREKYFPTHLLSGAMVCGKCGATIAQVSGKGGGYYGCRGATKGACDNKLLVRRSVVEKVILDTVRERLSDPQHIRHSCREQGQQGTAKA